MRPIALSSTFASRPKYYVDGPIFPARAVANGFGSLAVPGLNLVIRSRPHSGPVALARFHDALVGRSSSRRRMPPSAQGKWRGSAFLSIGARLPKRQRYGSRAPRILTAEANRTRLCPAPSPSGAGLFLGRRRLAVHTQQCPARRAPRDHMAPHLGVGRRPISIFIVGYCPLLMRSASASGHRVWARASIVVSYNQN